MACAICKTRREKRHCPGIQGEICTVCCGTQREETIDCPLDCEYLQISRLRENLDKDPAGIPNRDFPIPETFVKKNAHLLTLLEHAILLAALERNAVDSDIDEALEALVRTYRTLGSGLYYESKPSNAIAAAVFDSVQERVAEIRKLETENAMHKLHDSDLLGALVFLQQLEYALNNGRKRGRRFIEGLIQIISQLAEQERPESPSLIVS